MPSPPESSPQIRKKAAPEPLRRKRVQPAQISVFRRKPFQILLIFVTAVLLIDALVGDRGVVERLRAGREYHNVAVSLDALRDENARLRESARRLKEDPSTIESLAREELGLVRPGELLFIVKDVKPTK